MRRVTIFVALFALLFILVSLLVYRNITDKTPPEESVPWMHECSRLVEYPIPNDLPHNGWEETKWGEVHPEENITIVNILKLEGKWNFNLIGCAYENGTLFLKFNSKMMPEHTSTFETTTAPLLYVSILRVIPKVSAKRIIAYINGDMSKRIIIHLSY